MEADLHLHYGIDLTDPQVLGGRSWRWFVTRLVGLPDTSRTWRGLREHYQQGGVDADEVLDDADAELGVKRGDDAAS